MASLWAYVLVASFLCLRVVGSSFRRLRYILGQVLDVWRHNIYCTDFTCISYTFPFLLGTLLLCYPVTLLLCYLVTLLLCHPVTLQSCYSVTLLLCHLVTLLTLSLCYSCSDITCISYTFPFLLDTLLLCYPVTLLPWYSVILLPCYLVTLLPCYPVTF